MSIKTLIKNIAFLVVFSMVSMPTMLLASDETPITVSIPEIALLSSSGSPVFTVQAPATAGDEVTPPDDIIAQTYLHYTCNVSLSTGTRSISASLESSYGSDYKIKILVNPHGYGNYGTSNYGPETSNYLTLTQQDQVIINQIGNCFTGSGESDGAQIDYKMVFDTMAAVVPHSKIDNITLKFTLSNES